MAKAKSSKKPSAKKEATGNPGNAPAAATPNVSAGGPAAEKGVKVTMARNVKHNGVSYKKGEDATLSKKDAELFAKKGFVEGKGAAKPAEPEAPEDGEGAGEPKE